MPDCLASSRCSVSRVFTLAWAALLATGTSLYGQASPPVATVHVPAGSLERIHANDNSRSAGRRSESGVELRLEAREGDWYPDGEQRPGIVVRAFGLEGGPLQSPGPLVRVPLGTQVRMVVRNRLTTALAVHGLYSRHVDKAPPPAVIPAGESRDIAFVADRAGTFYYWAAAEPDTALANRKGIDTQLTGAIVVDDRAGISPPADRVLLITSWSNDLPVGAPGRLFRFTVNGRSWPATERLSYAVGDTARMRVINAGGGVHPMHLHGFYFNVDSRGNGHHDAIAAAGSSPRMAVTERVVPGGTFSLTWKPTRPGNWLFHCHDNVHLDHGGAFAVPSAHTAAATGHAGNHALEMMAGPVMGIAVTGASMDAPEPGGERRRLELVARVDSGGTPAEPAFGYTLHEGSRGAAPAGPYLPGPTMVLKRGQPVSVTVVNELPDPTAVHWHGIELESYFDGVAGFAGEGARVAPAVPPGGSFEARFTPPRSGTFIYHTHLDDTRQQQAGLSGALLVVNDPATYDPSRDIVLLVTIPRTAAEAANAVLLNGSPRPEARTMRVGERYRLRFINAHTFRPSMRMRLLRGTTASRWRAVAKDGMDLPADQAVETTSEVQMGNGETYDYEFAPTEPGEMKLDITDAAGRLLASMPIRVQ
jgi:FtsP/CotA-like multicopper oxidase with cupredoxin domain